MLIGIDASPLNRHHKTGTEWYTHHLILNLAKIDFFNQYLLYCREPLRGEFTQLPANFKIKVLNWPINKFWTQGRLSLEMLMRPPEILFVPAQALPLICPKKVITTVHDIGFERFPEYYSGFARRYLRFSTKFVLKKATKIIAVSNFTKEELIDIYQTDENKIKVVYNGYNQFYQKSKSPRVSQKILNKLKIKKPFLLSIGRLEKKKNTPGIIESFRILIADQTLSNFDLQLVLVGQPGLGYNEIKEQIRKSKLTDRVILTGWLNDQVKAGLIEEAEVFVFPSFYEGFGIPIIEAMAAGIPVVTSNVASCPEIAEKAALIVDPQNHQAIAEATKKILLDSQLKEELIKRGLERAKAFSWQKCAQETLRILE
jgi:glycosyltransferase involved in cell wall biosynthesis